MLSSQHSSRRLRRQGCVVNIFVALVLNVLMRPCNTVHVFHGGDNNPVASDVQALAVSFNLGILDVQQDRDDPIKTGMFLFPPDSLVQQDKFEVITLQYESDVGFWFANN